MKLKFEFICIGYIYPQNYEHTIDLVLGPELKLLFYFLKFLIFFQQRGYTISLYCVYWWVRNIQCSYCHLWSLGTFESATIHLYSIYYFYHYISDICVQNVFIYRKWFFYQSFLTMIQQRYLIIVFVEYYYKPPKIKCITQNVFHLLQTDISLYTFSFFSDS